MWSLLRYLCQIKLVLKNRKNNKNIENKRGSDMWHKKSLLYIYIERNVTLYIYYWLILFIHVFKELILYNEF